MISRTTLADIGLIDVTGSVDLNGGPVSVDIQLLDGFDPTTAGTFTFLDYSGTLDSEAFTLEDPNVDPNGTFSIGYDTGDAYLIFTPNSTSTPEPSTFALLAGLLGSLVFLVRRRAAANKT